MVQEKVIAGLTVLLPTDDEEPAAAPAAPRLATFDGKVIGFLSNTKDNVEPLFVGIQQHLQGAHRVKGVVHRTKTHFAVRAPQDMLEELHQQCDAVIVAAGA
ncbi:hypothetical protein NKDENANG_01835 [Candidatus Entotheonellaceae bacterium PAL068K]